MTDRYRYRCPHCGSVEFTRRQPGHPASGLPADAPLYRCDNSKTCGRRFDDPVDAKTEAGRLERAGG